MPHPFHDLLDDVQALERRNRAVALLFVALSLAVTLAALYIIASYYPRWRAYVALPVIPGAFYWVIHAGVRPLSVSRLDAATLIDSTLATRNRAATLVELELSHSSTHKAHIDLLTGQLTSLIPLAVSAKMVNPYKLTKAERRAVLISISALLGIALLILLRPISAREQFAREIESLLAATPELQQEAKELTTRAIETLRDADASPAAIRSAIQDARSALTRDPSQSSQAAITCLVITPSTRVGDAPRNSPPTRPPETSSPQAQPPESQNKTSQPQSKESDKKSADSPDTQRKQQEQASSAQSSSSSDKSSQEKGAGQQRSGDGSQDDSSTQSNQSENQKDSSEKGETSGDSGQKSQSNESSGKDSEQSNNQQSGGSQGSGSGKGGNGNDPSQESQEEGTSGGGKGRGGSNKGGEQEQGSDTADSGSPKEGSSGTSGAQKLSDALAKAEKSLGEGSDGKENEDPSGKGSKESSATKKNSKPSTDGRQESEDRSESSKSGSSGSRPGERKSDEASGKEPNRDALGKEGSQSNDNSKNPDQSSKNGKDTSPSDAKGAESSKQGEQTSQPGSPETSRRSEKTEDDDKAANTRGNNDGKGEKSRVVEGKATPRHYEEGGPDGPPGPGLGGKERFNDVQLGNTQESFDARFTGQDATEEEGKAPAQPKTTIEDLTLSKPKPAVERGEQRIPLEYRDVLR